MDIQELSNQVAELSYHVVELFKQQNEVFSEKFEKLENRIDNLENEVKRHVLDSETNVSKRIEALFDGYKLTHEKQWEQDRKIEALQAQMEAMHIRLASLENKSA